MCNNEAMIRCRLRFLLAEKAEKEHRKKGYTIRDVATATGLSTNIILRYINDRFERIDKTTVDTLCKFLGCEVGDLLVYEKPEDSKTESIG